LSTQKYPKSSKAFVAADIPEPLSPVMITILGAASLLWDTGVLFFRTISLVDL
jgi:hypothetical protein